MSGPSVGRVHSPQYRKGRLPCKDATSGVADQDHRAERQRDPEYIHWHRKKDWRQEERAEQIGRVIRKRARRWQRERCHTAMKRNSRAHSYATNSLRRRAGARFPNARVSVSPTHRRPVRSPIMATPRLGSRTSRQLVAAESPIFELQNCYRTWRAAKARVRRRNYRPFGILPIRESQYSIHSITCGRRALTLADETCDSALKCHGRAEYH